MLVIQIQMNWLVILNYTSVADSSMSCQNNHWYLLGNLTGYFLSLCVTSITVSCICENVLVEERKWVKYDIFLLIKTGASGFSFKWLKFYNSVASVSIIYKHFKQLPLPLWLFPSKPLDAWIIIFSFSFLHSVIVPSSLDAFGGLLMILSLKFVEVNSCRS